MVETPASENVDSLLDGAPAALGLREVKVKLPADQVLRLHYARMKRRKNFSQIVSTALTRYLDDLLKS